MAWYFTAQSARWSTVRRGRPAAAAALLPAAYDRVSPRHTAEAAQAARAFDSAFQRSFRPEAADDPEGVVRELFAARAKVLTALNQVRLRLPNDLDAEREVDRAIEDADRDMLERIEDARERCGSPLLHPGPLGSWGYGRWYRAPNDFVA
jgi:hypothetical protein